MPDTMTDVNSPKSPAKSGGILGFFSKLGQGLSAAAPAIQQIGDSLVSAGGSPLQQQSLQARQQLGLQRQQLGMQQQVQQSGLDTAALQRQHLGQEISSFETPEQQRAAALKQNEAIQEQNKTLAAPIQFPAVNDEGQNALFEKKYNQQSHGYDVSPVTMTRDVPNPDADKIVPPFAPPPATIKQTRQLLAPPAGIAFSPAGIDLDPNSPTYGQSIQYVRNKTTGENMKTVVAPGTRGTLDFSAPMVTNAQRSVTQPTGEITKEDFTTTRQRLLPGSGGNSGGSASNRSSLNPLVSGNLGSGPVIGGKVPTPVTKAFADVQDATNRLQTMQRDLEQISKNPANTGSFDMDLISQHIALTFGSAKNVRGGEALIEHHIKARSLPDNLVVMYEHLKNGGVLSDSQRQNFLHLAQSRLQTYQDAYGRAQNEAKGGFGMGNASTPPPTTGASPTTNSNNPLGL